jgi:hypothetical protein
LRSLNLKKACLAGKAGALADRAVGYD